MTSYSRIRVVISGKIAGAQGFSFGYDCASGSPQPTTDELTALMNVHRTGLNAVFTGAGPIGLMSADTVIDTLDAYYYAPGSKKASAQVQLALGPFAGTSQNSLPTQLALVVSLRTGLAGAHNRGRMYLCADGVSTTNHQLTQTQANQVAAKWATFFHEMKTGFGTAGQPSVAGVASSTAGDLVPITSVVVDTRVDIQRRRADKISAIGVASSPVT